MTTPGPFQVHTEARGPHWVAWITQGSETKPYRSVILIAANQADAEARGKDWADQQSAQ